MSSPEWRNCAEVEAAIYEHPTLTTEELGAFLSKRIAAFMIPSHVLIVPDPLPRSRAGKFLKRELRESLVSPQGLVS